MFGAPSKRQKQGISLISCSGKTMKRIFMRLIWIGLLGAGAIVLFGAVKSFQSMTAHAHYHFCLNHREELDAARYWYALDNGMTNAPGLNKEQLLLYAEDEAFTCPDGGSYSIDPKSLRVVCSNPEHMSASCYGHRTATRELEGWSRIYPIAYRSSDMWRYVTADTREGTIFRMSGATIVFKDLHGWNWIGKVQEMKVSGPGTYNCRFEFEDKGKVVTESYENGIRKFDIAGHVVRVSERGRLLQVDTNTFDISEVRPRIVVDGRGAARFE